jgi:hypothetical protein
MVIFGGLEIVAGGYLIQRHYKHKNAKKRQADEVEARRHNTFPGARPQCYYQPTQQPVIQTQKYAYYAPGPSSPQQHQQPYSQPYQGQSYGQPRPVPPQHTQSFSIPRRPLPDQKPQIIIEPSLHRTDSFATLSRMPIANGYRPQGLPEDPPPVLPPRQHATGLQPATTHGVYGNAGFSVSTPAFGATPTSPALTYTIGTGQQALGGHSVDDNWETYQRPSNNAHANYAPTEASTQLGERDPPPPYAP